MKVGSGLVTEGLSPSTFYLSVIRLAYFLCESNSSFSLGLIF